MESDTKCPACEGGVVTLRTVTKTLTRGPLTVVVRGVPAFVCDHCGEEIITSDTMRNLEAVMANAEKFGVVHQLADYRRDVA
jgi:YgiT-type zinc finger domain-containing protein